MKRLKPFLYKIKWLVLLVKHFLKSKNFRQSLLSLKVSNGSLNELETSYRKLIQKYPAWLYGHYLLGIISAKKYELERNQLQRGLLSLSKEVLSAYKNSYRKSILEILILFFEKKYSDVLKNGAIIESKNISHMEERKILFETLGFSAFILNEEEIAKDYFLKIPKKLRTPEVASIIDKLEGEI